MSVSLGWGYGKCLRWETDLFVGMLPRTSASSAKLVYSFRETFSPTTVRIGTSRFSLCPATLFLGASLLTGDGYWFSQPSRYPRHYYQFPTRISINAGFGQRCDFVVSRSEFKRKTISFYYDLGTCDKYLIIGVENKSIKFSDIIKLDFGLRIQIL